MASKAKKTKKSEKSAGGGGGCKKQAATKPGGGESKRSSAAARGGNNGGGGEASPVQPTALDARFGDGNDGGGDGGSKGSSAAARASTVSPRENEDDEVQRLRNESRLQAKRIEMLEKEKVERALSDKSKWEQRWARRAMQGDESGNNDKVAEFMKNRVYPKFKFLPAGCMRLSKDPRSLRVMLIRVCQVPEGETGDSYWMGKVAHIAFYMHGTHRGRIIKKMSVAYFGKGNFFSCVPI